MPVSDWSANPDLNTTVDGINIAEGCDPSNVNDAIRAIMADVAAISVREKLTANRDYYVRADGSDSNNGLTNISSGAFLTIQKAIDAAYTLDMGPYATTIHVADGTYTGQIKVNGPILSANTTPLTIIGNITTPANVLLSITGTALEMHLADYLYLQGVKLSSSGGFDMLIESSHLEFGNIDFGNCDEDMILATRDAFLRARGPITVSGDAVSFCHSTARSRVEFTDQTITFSGARTFSTYLWGLNDAAVALDGVTLAGTRPTGSTLVHERSIINASSISSTGWGFLGIGSYDVNDDSVVTTDALLARTIYVRSDARSDQNDGGENTTERAFKTIQGAVNYLSKLQFNPAANQAYTIQLADGTYNETVTLTDAKFPSATINGNSGVPSNVLVNGVTDGVIALGLSTRWLLTGLKLTAAAGSGIRAENGSRVSFGALNFGSCSVAHIAASSGSILTATSNYTISANAPMHLQQLQGSKVDISGFTVTLSGTLAFSTAFARVWGTSFLKAWSTVYSGTATGVKYDLRTNGVIDTNGAGTSALPGGTAGTAATGGQYA